jgi:hypothetical protein
MLGDVVQHAARTSTFASQIDGHVRWTPDLTSFPAPTIQSGIDAEEDYEKFREKTCGAYTARRHLSFIRRRAMKVLVAGATGAIGRPLIRCLKEGGHALFGLARSSDSASALVENVSCTSDCVRWSGSKLPSRVLRTQVKSGRLGRGPVPDPKQRA